MKSKHPSLLYFGDTQNQAFPLILVFGREPNTSLEIGNAAGSYDFRDYSSRFWDETYWQIASCVGMSDKTFKAACVAKDSSPILFASPLPIGIESQVDDKWSIRAVVPKDKIESHIRQVFSFSSLIKRVSIIVLSGIERDEFRYSREAISASAKSINIPVVSVTYFGDTYRRPNGCVFEDDGRLLIREVLKGFALN
jgi:hypothetical protein